MKSLRNRKTAALIMLLVIAVSFFTGGRRTLSERSKQVSDVFYNGEYGDGLGIHYDLQQKIDDAYNLRTVAGRYLPETHPSMQAVSEARQALADAAAISGMAKANRQLTEAVDGLYSALETEPLSEQDAVFRRRLYADLSAADSRMRLDKYNKAAQEFNRILEKQPAAFIAGVTGLKRAEIFG